MTDMVLIFLIICAAIPLVFAVVAVVLTIWDSGK